MFVSFRLIGVATLGLVLTAGMAAACETYQAHPADELKTLRDALQNPAMDPFDRLFAFQELVCSDQPVVRDFAIREGLNSARDGMVRNQILLDALMAKQQIDVEIKPQDQNERKTAERMAGPIMTFNVRYRDHQAGCASFSDDSKCRTNSSLFVKGDLVQFQNDGYIGSFRLTETNELIGSVRFGSLAPVSATMRLF